MPNSHVSKSECIHHHCQCQFHPLHFYNASLRRFNRLVKSVEGPEEEEEMMLVTTVAPGPRPEGCLLAGARREIRPSSPEWSTPTGRELIAKGVKVETDMMILDKRAFVPLSLEESALVPKERIVPSRMVLVEKRDDDGNRFVKARSFCKTQNSCLLSAKWLHCKSSPP